MGWAEAGINCAFSNSNGGEPIDWSNPDLVLIQVRRNGNSLALASRKLKNRKNIVLAAVTQNGAALRFASKKRRADPAIVIPAVEQDQEALQFASLKLQSQIHFVDGKAVLAK